MYDPLERQIQILQQLLQTRLSHLLNQRPENVSLSLTKRYKWYGTHPSLAQDPWTALCVSTLSQ